MKKIYLLTKSIIFFALLANSCTKNENPISSVTEEENGSQSEIIGTAKTLEDMGDYCLMGGDIILDKRNPNHVAIIQHLNSCGDTLKPSGLAKTQAFRIDGGTWPNGVVRYTLSGFSATETSIIKNAMDSISFYCGVTWKKDSGLRNYAIKKNPIKNICGNSTLGYGLYNYCNLGCIDVGTAIHEFLHGIGMQHEHQRPDRPITVNLNNVLDEFKPYLRAIAGSKTIGPYDYESIMHYPSYISSFAKDRSQRIIDAGAYNNVIGQRNHLSNGDILGMRKMYGPSSFLFASADFWGSSGSSFSRIRWSTDDGGFGADNRWLPGDYNNDGLTDMAHVFSDGFYAFVDVWKSTGSGFKREHWATREGGFASGSYWVSGDFDNNGKTDIAQIFNNNGLIDVDVWKSTGSGFTREHWATRDGGFISGAHWLTGNFDNSGATDIAHVFSDGVYAFVDVWKSTGSGFKREHWATREGGFAKGGHWVSGNFDNSGATDIAQIFNDGGLTDVDVWKSTGSGFKREHWATRNGGFISGAAWIAGNFDNSGATDIAQIFNDGGYASVDVWKSTNTGFNRVRWATRNGGFGVHNWWLPGSFNAGTAIDIVHVIAGPLKGDL